MFRINLPNALFKVKTLLRTCFEWAIPGADVITYNNHSKVLNSKVE